LLSVSSAVSGQSSISQLSRMLAEYRADVAKVYGKTN
jgi:hypothetical protein